MKTALLALLAISFLVPACQSKPVIEGEAKVRLETDFNEARFVSVDGNTVPPATPEITVSTGWRKIEVTVSETTVAVGGVTHEVRALFREPGSYVLHVTKVGGGTDRIQHRVRKVK